MIFLIGMPGAGKSYWSGKLALAKDLQLMDMDELIESRECCSIAQLFIREGEDSFRAKETHMLKEIIATGQQHTIVATGGGTPCFGDNLQLMKAAGTVVYLQAEVQTLLSQLNTETDKRPLLANKTDLTTYLEELLATRHSAYEQAHHILQVKDISLATFDKIISVCINQP